MMYKLSNNFKEFVEQNKSDNPLIQEVISVVLKEGGSIDEIKHILVSHSTTVEELKEATLDYLIGYAHFILKDDCITENELNDFTALKRIFRIKESDFISFKSFRVTEIVKLQLLRIYSDNYVDKEEALTNVNLQFMFDLSHDDFEKMKEDEVIAALLQGANPKDLDISKIPNGFQL